MQCKSVKRKGDTDGKDQKTLVDTKDLIKNVAGNAGYCKDKRLQLMAGRHMQWIEAGNVHTSNCIIIQTRIRSAIDGWGLPNKNFVSPFSHIDSNLLSDCTSSFSACFAASGLCVRPRKGASALFITRVATQV
uniref:Uncharacterized protein n=1 Tax=Arundo donax TaxID=35708 RepID=A0A0A8XPX1_ARUDO